MKKTKLFLTLCLSTYIGFAQIISTIAGNGTWGFTGDGGQATAAELYWPSGVAIDASGNIYIADSQNHRVRKINTSGVISTYAGTGVAGFSSDGVQATTSKLNFPTGVALDASGNLYIADYGNNRVRVVYTSGIIDTDAGNGTAGFSGDGSVADAAELFSPTGVTFDASGNHYITDYGNFRIRKVNTVGGITTVAGNGTSGFTGDGGQATAAEINTIGGLALDAAGNLYIADFNNFRIRKVNTSGVISTIVGDGTAGFSGDGGQATAAHLNAPVALVVDNSTGNIYVSDRDNNRIRKINTSGIISTFAGNGTAGFSGDGGQATAAKLNSSSGYSQLAIGSFGSLYIADRTNYRIRKITMPCPADAGPNVNDYINSGDGGLCSGVQIGTPSISGLTYAWAPTTSLSCNNCAQPTCSITTTQIYTVTVSGSGCTTATSTVQVTTLTPILTASINSTSAIPGSNITVTGTYTGNVTPNYYYCSILQTDQWGNPITGGYSWGGWTAGAPSGPFTFANTSTLTCNTYYQINFIVQNTIACLNWEPASGVIVYLGLTANAGSNQTNYQDVCGSWTPGVTIGTSASGMSYTWSPSTNLSPTNTATTTSTYSTTLSSQTITYTLTVSKTGCTSATSTVHVTAVKQTCIGCCREMGLTTQNNEQINFAIYPNPANSQVTVSLYDKAEYIRIVDLSGRILFETKDVTDSEYLIDVSKYAKGVYFVIAKIGNKLEKQKLLIE